MYDGQITVEGGVWGVGEGVQRMTSDVGSMRRGGYRVSRSPKLFRDVADDDGLWPEILGDSIAVDDGEREDGEEGRFPERRTGDPSERLARRLL